MHGNLKLCLVVSLDFFFVQKVFFFLSLSCVDYKQTNLCVDSNDSHNPPIVLFRYTDEFYYRVARFMCRDERTYRLLSYNGFFNHLVLVKFGIETLTLEIVVCGLLLSANV